MREGSRLSGAAWIRLRNDVLARDDRRCANCGAESELEVHHVVPLSREGKNRTTNLLTLCRTCHESVHDRAARVETDDSRSDRIRWLPTIENVRRLVRTTYHPLERAVIVPVAKTGVGAGEVCNLLLEDVALADPDTRELLNVAYPSWDDGTASLLRVRGTIDENDPGRRSSRSTENSARS